MSHLSADTRAWPDDPYRILAAQDSLNNIWQEYRDGDPWSARSRLESPHAREPHNEELIVRLYWMRRLDADDSDESIVRWLCQLVRHQAASGQAWTVLLRHFELNPTAALGVDASELVTTLEDTEWLMPLLQVRWSEAARRDDWTLVQSDIESVETRYGLQDEQLCATLMTRALRQLVWYAESHEEFDWICRRVDELKYEGHLSTVTDDELEHLVALRGQLTCLDSTSPLLKVLQDCGISTAEHPTATSVFELASRWSSDPSSALRQLDDIFQHSTHLFHELWQHLESANQCDRDIEPEIVNQLVDHFISTFVEHPANVEMVEHRLRALAFCVREAITIDQLAALLSAAGGPPIVQRLSLRLFYDQPLACLCDGIRVIGWLDDQAGVMRGQRRSRGKSRRLTAESTEWRQDGRL